MGEGSSFGRSEWAEAGYEWGEGKQKMGKRGSSSCTAPSKPPSERLAPLTSREARLVLDIVRAADRPKGVVVSAIKSLLSTEIVNSAMEELLGLEFIYNTLDKYHVATIDYVGWWVC